MKAVAKTVEPAGRETQLDHIRPQYLEALTLVERLHRRLLDVIKDEFDRRGRSDINSVQALLLYNIGDKELTAGELRTRGYYLGSNVSYNLKKLVEMAFLDHQRSRVDRRSVRIKLTDKGREEARQIGAAFRELKIPIEKVLASPRCRTMETAMLAFGRAEKASEARGGHVRDPDPQRYAGLRQLLSTPRQPSTNLVIASHGNPFYATAGAPYLAEGEAAVIRPLGKDFEIVARVRHDAWRTLAKN